MLEINKHYIGFSKRKHSVAPVVKVSVVLLTATSVFSHLKMDVAMANALCSPPTIKSPNKARKISFFFHPIPDFLPEFDYSNP